MKKLLILAVLFLFSCGEPSENNRYWVVDKIIRVDSEKSHYVMTMVEHSLKADGLSNNIRVYGRVGQWQVGDTVYMNFVKVYNVK